MNNEWKICNKNFVIMSMSNYNAWLYMSSMFPDYTVILNGSYLYILFDYNHTICTKIHMYITHGIETYIAV